MPNAGYTFDPTALSDKELKDYLNYYEQAASRDIAASGQRAGGGGFVGATQGMLNRIKNEQAARQQKQAQSAQEEQFKALLSGGGGLAGQMGAQQAPAFDQAAYIQDLQNAAANERKAVEDIFSGERETGLRGLAEQYNPLRKQSIEEAAVLGNLRSPAFQSTTLANIDASRNRDTANLLAQLGIGRGQALTGVEQGLASQLGQGRQFGAQLGQQANQFGQELGFNKARTLAGLLQGESQFGRTQGLQERQLNAQQAQQNWENALNQAGLEQAGELGRMQANAQKKSGWDIAGNLIGGVSNLIGGVAGLASGLKGFKTPGRNSSKRRIGSIYDQPIGPQPMEYGPQNKNYYGEY